MSLAMHLPPLGKPLAFATTYNISSIDLKQVKLIEESLFACFRFFRQFLVLFAMHQMSMGLYRLVASIGRTQVMSNMLGTTMLIAMYILGGFVISKGQMI